MSLTNMLVRIITDSGKRKSLGLKLRTKRIVPLLEMIEKDYKRNGFVNIIDIGGTEQYWNIVPKEYFIEYKVKITIVNLYNAGLPKDHDQFKFIVGDGCNLKKIKKNSYHIAHSNSVIEHVGDWSRMVQFANELQRVSERYFIQTPNYWFPIEPHCMTPFFHWMPKPVCIWMIMHFSLGQWGKADSIDIAVRKVESARLLNRKMLRALFNNANILTERFFGLPKSFIAIKK